MRSSPNLLALIVFTALSLPSCSDRSQPPQSQPSCSIPNPAELSIGTNNCPSGGLCFFAMGDTGTGACDQSVVAAGVKAKCDADGCDFGVLLGDMFYPAGVTSANDPQWAAKFEQPYSGIDLPFYGVLGNHDYADTNSSLGDFYVSYAAGSAKFRMPDKFYGFEMGDALFLALDSQAILKDWGTSNADQAGLFSGLLSAPGKPWKIAMSHHPYLSNGAHGNAGSYDGQPAASLSSGIKVKEFLEAQLCGGVDVFLAGHDHSRQVLFGNASCSGVFVVSGGGGKSITPVGGANVYQFQKSSLGFAYFQITSSQLVIEMLDQYGQLEFSLSLP